VLPCSVQEFPFLSNCRSTLTFGSGRSLLIFSTFCSSHMQWAILKDFGNKPTRMNAR
jgi:hypothetical protein